MLDLWHRVQEGQKQWSTHLRILTTGASRYGWYQVQVVPIEGESGEAPIWVAIATEANKDVNSELATALKHKADDFETMMRVLPVGIAYNEDPENHVIRVNRALANMLGLEDADTNASKNGPKASQLPFRFFRDGRELDPQELPQQMVTRTGQELRDVRLEVGRSDGSIAHLYGHATPLINEDGTVRGSVSAYLDWTAQHAAEIALRERQAQLDSATQIAGLEMWSYNFRDSYATVSPRIDEWFGLPHEPEGRPGREYMKRVHPEDVERVGQAFRESMASNSVFETEFRVESLAGGVRWLLLRALLHKTLRGDEKLLGVVMDITQRKTHEQQLQQVNEELERFASVASHDLQEPLRMIAIYSELLLREYESHLSPKGKHYANTVRDGVGRMQRLINDLLAFSRVTSDSSNSGASAAGSDALAQAVKVCESMIQEANAVIEADPLPQVQIDEIKLAQVFQNLLSNSLKYRRSDVGAHVRVRAIPSGTFVKFVFEDNGMGFENKYAETIFMPFKRLQTTAHPGTGLGLSICRRIVEHAGGHMWAESTVGEGSKFYFTLRLV